MEETVKTLSEVLSNWTWVRSSNSKAIYRFLDLLFTTFIFKNNPSQIHASEKFYGVYRSQRIKYVKIYFLGLLVQIHKFVRSPCSNYSWKLRNRKIGWPSIMVLHFWHVILNVNLRENCLE